MSALMIGVTVAAALGRDAVLSRLSAGAGRLRRASGVLLVAAGGYQIYLFLFVHGGRELFGL